MQQWRQASMQPEASVLAGLTIVIVVVVVVVSWASVIVIIIVVVISTSSIVVIVVVVVIYTSSVVVVVCTSHSLLAQLGGGAAWGKTQEGALTEPRQGLLNLAY